MAYGCNLGPETMARLTNDVTYDDIQRITDWYLHEDALRATLADIVNAIAALETTQVWGDGRASSSDGQRFLFPRRVLRRTYSHRLGNYALEFYTFIANNYAPFYTVPIECTERDAPYVLDGLLYHESDLDPEEHYTDTHGYVELNFAAFPMFGKRFCPRIWGLHRQWIYRLEPHKDYGALTPIVSPKKRTLHLDWITEHWDRMGQFFASFAAGHTTASVALKRLLACGPRNHFSGPCANWGASIRPSSSLTISPIPPSGAGSGGACSKANTPRPGAACPLWQAGARRRARFPAADEPGELFGPHPGRYYLLADSGDRECPAPLGPRGGRGGPGVPAPH